MKRTTLTTSQARAFYDRLGSAQDSQGFYEDPALDDMVAHAGFEDAHSVFEFGCGTGKLAARLLARHLPATATYTGCDLSSTMVGLAMQRLAAFSKRTHVVQTDGLVGFPLADASVDRVLACYVLDLLSEEDIRQFFAEARRVLVPTGRLCLVSLTEGCSPGSKIVASLWGTVFRLRPSLVGGCRPIALARHADPQHWRQLYRNVRVSFAVPSEVLVLGARKSTDEVPPSTAPDAPPA